MTIQAADAFMAIFGYKRVDHSRHADRYAEILEHVREGRTTSRAIFEAMPYEYASPECVQNILKRLERAGVVRRHGTISGRGRATVWEVVE